MKILVTGANGFLGQHVVAAALARGLDVRVLVRPAAVLDRLPWRDTADVFRADLRTASNLEQAFDGVEVLVHLAAAVTGGEDAQFAATVVGTERLLDAMSRTACRRIVLASSFSVYDWSAIRGTLNEESPIESPPDLYRRDGYSIAKSWQERVTREYSAKFGWGLTVLRPGFIWGRDHAYLAALGQQVGPIHFVIGPLTHIPMTHVENCADLFVVAAMDARAVGQTLNVVDGPGERIWSFLGDYLKGMRERGFRIPVPYTLAYGLVKLGYETIFRRNDKLPQILIPMRFESRLKPLRYSNERAKRVLGWTPPLSFEQALDRTFGSSIPLTAGVAQPALSEESQR